MVHGDDFALDGLRTLFILLIRLFCSSLLAQKGVVDVSTKEATVKHVTVAATVAWILSMAIEPLGAQSLSVRGDRFAVNGQDKFLVFVSYFDGLSRPQAPDVGQTKSRLELDLEWLADKGVHGIRVFPQWRDDKGGVPVMMASDGMVTQAMLEKLTTLVSMAREEGLLVDVTFDPGLSGIMDPLHYKWGPFAEAPLPSEEQGLLRIARHLVPHRNVLFDLCNQFNNGGPPGSLGNCLPRFGTTENAITVLKSIRDGIAVFDPTRVVVLSTIEGSDTQAISLVESHGFDAVAYHDVRSTDWHSATDDRVDSLQTDLVQAPR